MGTTVRIEPSGDLISEEWRVVYVRGPTPIVHLNVSGPRWLEGGECWSFRRRIDAKRFCKRRGFSISA
jgi:hypothetical protein